MDVSTLQLKQSAVNPSTGEAIIAFATLTESNAEEEEELVKELRLLVREEIGPFAAPDIIGITPSLPMVSIVGSGSMLHY